MKKSEKVYIAGHAGMVGSAVTRRFKKEGFQNIVTRELEEFDLRDSQAVEEFFKLEKPDYVILAAAKVGGIKFNNTHQAEFLLENLQIQNNVIHFAYKYDCQKLCFLGSSCIYPRNCPQPMKEEYLLTGPFEPTNEGYAVAKMTGYKLAYFYNQQYGFNTISLMPCNLYGKNDCFDLDKSHVLSALIKRFVDASDDNKNEVTLWGSGSSRREFLNVDDAARAIFFLMEKWNNPEFINVGSGTDISIKDLALKIAGQTGFKGEIKWDTSKPDGMPLKCMDNSKITKLGFKPEITLDQGIEALIAEYRALKSK